MHNPDQPLAVTNPEAARSLSMFAYYMRNNDFERGLHYSRLAGVAGDLDITVSRLHALVLTRKFEAAAECAACALAATMHHSFRKAILGAVLPALYYLGGRDGDCSNAFGAAYEMASHVNQNPERSRWVGQPLQGRTVLVTLSEASLSGMGDHIMWARFVPYLAEAGARVIVQCSPALGRLFSTLPGVVRTCDYEERPQCDYATSITELPHLFGVRGFPVANPFEVRPAQLTPGTYNIGINWGASWGLPYMERSCALAEYLPLCDIPDVTLYALQKGAHQRQLYPPPTGMKVLDLSPRLGDFLDTAVALMSMDAVVTTDNAVGNLACMLGKPTFVLVPKCSDWRWGEGGKTPWYPSARVYQQDVIGEWAQPIARLAADLTAYLKEQGRPLSNPNLPGCEVSIEAAPTGEMK